MKILKTILVLFSIHAGTGFCGDEASSLPAAAQKIADQLAEWEGQQRRDTETRIQEKRDEVIEVMQSILRNETTNGNLDGAIAIREYINKLEEDSTSTESSPDDDGETMLTKPTKISLNETTWKANGQNFPTQFLKFDKRGTLLVVGSNGKSIETDYEIVEESGRFYLVFTHVVSDVKHTYEVLSQDGNPISLRGDSMMFNRTE